MCVLVWGQGGGEAVVMMQLDRCHSSNVSVKGQEARIAAVNGRCSPVLHRSSRVVRTYFSIASTFFQRPSAAKTCAGMLARERSVAQPARRPWGLIK